jgi:hypothetical protein
MGESVLWLPNADGTRWERLGHAMRDGLPVPNGFLALPSVPEIEIRAAYEDLKSREKTHFLALRGPSHAVLNVLGPDPLMHNLRRLWNESTNAPLLVQRMVHSVWSGKAQWHRKNLRIKANEGLMVLDPDTYLVDSVTGKCVRQTLEQKQRKMIRHVDGSSRVVEREGERTPMTAEQLAKIAELAVRVGTDIGWAIDDLENAWLLGIQI